MANEIIRVILVDDQEFVLHGLASLLQEVEQIQIIKSVKSGEHLMQWLETSLERQPADVILMDINMPYPGLDGIETAQKVKQLFPSIKILMLSVNDDFETFLKAKRIGVNGYISKIKGKKEILDAIFKAKDGKFIDYFNY